MRDWATCGKKVAGFLPKGVGRSCALIYEETSFPQLYCIKIQIYDEVRKDSGENGCFGPGMRTGFSATIWPNICNPSTIMFDMAYVFLPEYQQLATLAPRSHLLEIANVLSEAQVPVFRHVQGDHKAIPMTEMPTVVVTHG